jgi:hypothetical protein
MTARIALELDGKPVEADACQTKPVGAKSIETSPDNINLILESKTVEPNPRVVGLSTFGPSVSRHNIWNSSPSMVQAIATCPRSLLRLPYLAAFVASS